MSFFQTSPYNFSANLFRNIHVQLKENDLENVKFLPL